MLRFIYQKLMNKRWLILCIIIGNILMVGIASCNPMYTKAALQKMLTKDMNTYLEQNNVYPGTVYVEAKLSNKRLETYSSSYFTDYMQVSEKIQEMYGMEPMDSITIYANSNGQIAKYETARGSGSASIEVKVASISNLGDHIELLSGEMYSSEKDSEGIIDCIVNERVYLSSDMVIGDVIRMTDYTDVNDNPIRLRVVGVFRAANTEDSFWVKDPLSYEEEFFIDQELYEECFMTGQISGNITAKWYTLYDYTGIEVAQVEHMLAMDNALYEDYLVRELYYADSMFHEIFEEFVEDSSKVSTTMWILQVPILVLLAVFIFMVSNQVISIEQSEIAMLKSRGVSKRQLIMTYLIQAVILASIALVVGIPFGYLLCHLFGSTNAFLEFVGRRAMDVKITGTAIVYAVIAAVASVLIMTLPVLRYAKFSIVEQKANRRKKNSPMWQRMFLDFALLAIACYGFYNFNSQKDLLLEKVANGEALDPMLFMSASLFILSCAIVFLRVIPFLAYTIFRIGRKLWKPAGYASFLQITRDIRKQNFITVFLVLTIALGIFNANIARTVNENEELRLRYNDGADLVVQEAWISNKSAVKMGYAEELIYQEADYEKYKLLAEEHSEIKAMTKVMRENNAQIYVGGETLDNCMFMAINTYEFGHTAWMPEGYTAEHWYNYLNALSQNPEGCIISSNLANLMELSVGDSISVYRINEVNDGMGRKNLTITAIVDLWPCYENKVKAIGEDGVETYIDQYLVVANMENTLRDFPLTPYEIWFDIEGSTDFFYDWAEENKVSFTSFTDAEADIVSLKNDPYFQVTNGMLTITFIVVLVLCAIGFLIYWITSIRSRELIFGIYRAMGMSMKEIILMLINEHFFGSILPIAFGAAVGYVASKMFIPLIQIAYSPSVKTLPTRIFMANDDMIRIGVVVLLMLMVCLGVISVLLSKIKINQALKLGED